MDSYKFFFPKPRTETNKGGWYYDPDKFDLEASVGEVKFASPQEAAGFAENKIAKEIKWQGQKTPAVLIERQSDQQRYVLVFDEYTKGEAAVWEVPVRKDDFLDAYDRNQRFLLLFECLSRVSDMCEQMKDDRLKHTYVQELLELSINVLVKLAWQSSSRVPVGFELDESFDDGQLELFKEKFDALKEFIAQVEADRDD